MFLSLLLLAAAAQPDPEIIVSASREAVETGEAAASSTIFDDELLRSLTLPNAADLLRLSPGVDVATTGPRGTQTQLRIRGAEANHTLLFVDGIRFNDPAAGNEPRFELLTTDLASRIELVRGPQSALWGAEALGGVIAVQSVDPFARPGLLADAEYGRLDSSRLFGRYAFADGPVGLAATAGWQRSDGIDSFGGEERDGFETLSASLRAVYRGDNVEAGAVGHWIEGTSEYDGFDPVTFLRSNTLDETDNRIAAVRGWLTGEWEGWRLSGEASYLDSANRNTLAGAPLNRTFGDRTSLGAQVSRRLGGHLFIAAAEHSEEDFRARDDNFGGGTNQDRSRSLTAFIGEWRAEWSEVLVTDVAVRHDDFSAFENATTFRASALVRPGGGWTLHAAYGEGIAQPTFYDLFGFFPGSFAGNPNLTPERSRGFEAGLRWANARASVGITGFSNRLSNEIVDVFDPVTFQSSTANASGRSRREGVELAASWRHADWLNLAVNYTWLDSDQQTVAGAALVREVRRARHSANLLGHGEAGRLSWGASLAYVGRRRDTDFDLFPAQTVTLDDYLLASLRIGWRILPRLELYGRVENGFDADYQDVVGYNTPGRTVHAGLRILLGN
ncbi:MAG: TonB-dependent receptor plug domain-containing protein [Sphingosinicella sp.]|uniref:TonB-dependent receptor plug domain-containing protein n=1 Tax=Sphingosinicella sp. TaxID=1917971 RepID=UPI0040382A56